MDENYIISFMIILLLSLALTIKNNASRPKLIALFL